jgi:non-heme chloroperoxidase
LEDPIDPAFVREFQESNVVEPVPSGFMDAMVAESLKVPARVWRNHLRQVLDAPPPADAGQIEGPALILWGDRDPYAPRADQERLAAEIPDARLLVMEGVGHVPFWERPERTAAEIASFALSAARAPVAAG